MKFELDPHLAAVGQLAKEKLSPGEDDVLIRLLRSEPLGTLQVELLRCINGELTQLSALDLSKDGAILRAARIQGKIAGLRGFFDIAAELINVTDEGEPK